MAAAKMKGQRKRRKRRWMALRLPPKARRNLRVLIEAEAVLIQREGRQPSAELLAAQTGIALAEVYSLWAARRAVRNLSSRLQDERLRLRDAAPLPFDELAKIERRERILAVLRTLHSSSSSRQRRLICLRFGLGDNDGLSDNDRVADCFSYSLNELKLIFKRSHKGSVRGEIEFVLGKLRNRSVLFAREDITTTS
jgi:DNA-directed RNA polymerase sigma subunit (sigma70/sigma32)